MIIDQFQSRLKLAAGMVIALSALGVSVPAALAQVTPDGRSATTVTTVGAVTDVQTSTVVSNHGVNTFSSFSTGVGSTTNLHVPSGARGTVNIVIGSRSQINGTVRSIRNGGVDGDLYFANPSGFVVGPSGAVQAGSVNVSTPSQEFVDEFVGTSGVSGSHVDRLIAGAAPLSDAGIDVQGTIQGNSAVRLRTGGDIGVSGQINAGDRATVMRGAVRQSGPMPGVDLDAGGRLNITGTGRISSVDGPSGGTVKIRGSEVRLQPGARILAQGEGAGAGGIVDVFARGAAVLDAGATISVAALAGGPGGQLGFNGETLTEVNGLLDAASLGGEAGLVSTTDRFAVNIDMDTGLASARNSGGSSFVQTAAQTLPATPPVAPVLETNMVPNVFEQPCAAEPCDVRVQIVDTIVQPAGGTVAPAAGQQAQVEAGGPATVTETGS